MADDQAIAQMGKVLFASAVVSEQNPTQPVVAASVMGGADVLLQMMPGEDLR